MKAPSTALRALSFAAVSAVAVGSLSAATLTLTSAQDSFIRPDASSNNGDDNLFLVGDTLTTTSPGTLLRGLLSFDFSSSTELVGATINSVKLTLTVNDGSEASKSANQSVTIDLYTLVDDFYEGPNVSGDDPAFVTWTSSGISGGDWTDGGNYTTLLSSTSANASTVTTGTKVEFNSTSALTSAVSTSVSSTSGLLNLLLKLDTEDNSQRNVFRFTSSEFVTTGGVTAAFVPSLTIDYTAAAIPEPSAFALLGGLAALGFVAGRRRRAA